MKLNELSPATGSVKEAYRKGRGAGSGNGKTAGRGHKGQKPCAPRKRSPAPAARASTRSWAKEA